MQADANERLKTIKTIRRGRGYARAQRVWCKRPFPKKIKKIKISIFKIEKTKNQKNLLTCAYVCMKDEKLCYFQMCDAIKHRNIAFKGIFSPVERILYVWWTIYPPCSRKRLRTP